MQQLRQLEVGYRSNVKNKVLKESLILTGDQSIVDMQYAVQYRIVDPKAWLFNNNPGSQPEELIRQSAETAMRETVGRRQIDQVLYEEKEQVAKISQKLMQDVLDLYKAGVSVVDVTVQQVQPPEQVQTAFEDANKAAQDRERLINEGRAYANDVIPKARGTAARLLQEADGGMTVALQREPALGEHDATRPAVIGIRLTAQIPRTLDFVCRLVAGLLADTKRSGHIGKPATRGAQQRDEGLEAQTQRGVALLLKQAHGPGLQVACDADEMPRQVAAVAAPEILLAIDTRVSWAHLGNGKYPLTNWQRTPTNPNSGRGSQVDQHDARHHQQCREQKPGIRGLAEQQHAEGNAEQRREEREHHQLAGLIA